MSATLTRSRGPDPGPTTGPTRPVSILYQALSRAARENARRSATGSAAETGAGATAPEPATRAGARLRNFTALSFRPRRSQAPLDSRKTLMIGGIMAGVLVAGWLAMSSMSSGGGVADILAEIPIVSEVAALVGLEPEPLYYVPEEPLPEVAAADPTLAATDDGAIAQPSEDGATADGIENDDLAMMTPPAAVTDSAPLEGGGIEIDAAAVEEAPAEAQADKAGSLGETVTVVPDQTAVVENAQEPATLLPQDAPATDSLHPTDAPPAAARETLEQTLQRLANERGFTDLAPPVEISRTVAPADDAAATETPTADPNFSITVDDRAQVQQASFEAAYSSLLAGNTEGALNLYLDVLKDDPDNTFALFGLASTLQRIGWLAEARATYEELLAIEPDNRGALANMMTLISQEAPDQALSNLGRLYEINPGFSPIPAQMAVLYAGQGDYAQAIRFLELASELSPENMMYVYNLAIIHDRLGDHEEARALYEKVLSAAEIRDVSIPLEAVRERVSYLKKL